MSKRTQVTTVPDDPAFRSYWLDGREVITAKRAEPGRPEWVAVNSSGGRVDPETAVIFADLLRQAAAFASEGGNDEPNN